MAGNSWQPSTNVLTGGGESSEWTFGSKGILTLWAPGSSSLARTTRAASGSSPSKDGPTGEMLAGDGRPGAEFTWEGFDEGDQSRRVAPKRDPQHGVTTARGVLQLRR